MVGQADEIYSILKMDLMPSDNPRKQLKCISDLSENLIVPAKDLYQEVNNTLALYKSNNPIQVNLNFSGKRNFIILLLVLLYTLTPNAHTGDWYWLMDGISIDDTIYVFALRLNSTSGGLGFEVNGVALIKFNLDEENFIKNVQQFDTPLFYQDTSANWDIVLGQAIMPMTNASGNPNTMDIFMCTDTKRYIR